VIHRITVAGFGALTSAMKRSRRLRRLSDSSPHCGPCSARWHLRSSIRAELVASVIHRLTAARLRSVDICDSASGSKPLPQRPIASPGPASACWHLPWSIHA